MFSFFFVSWIKNLWVRFLIMVNQVEYVKLYKDIGVIFYYKY